MLSLEQAKRNRRELMKQIAIEHQRKDRETLAKLRAKIRSVKTRRKEALGKVVQSCRVGRTNAKERMRSRVDEIRRDARERVKHARQEEKLAARATCATRKAKVKRAAMSAAEKRRAHLVAERKYQKEIERIDRATKKRRARHERSAVEVRQESDDEVRHNIPAEMVPAFDRVKKTIKASARQSRTEAFLHYAEENPSEIVDAQEEISRREIARLIREESALRHSMRSPRRYRPTAQELASVPF